MRIRAVAALIATVTVWVGVTAATAPEPTTAGTPHAAAETSFCGTVAQCDAWDEVADRAYEAGQSFDLTHEDTSDTSCWVEKATSPATAEVICGARGLRPATDTVDIGAAFGGKPDGDCSWSYVSYPWDGSFGLEPNGCN